MASGIFAVGVDLVEEAGLQNRRLEHAVTAVQIADDQELVLPIGPRRDDVDVTVEKRRLSGELFEAAPASLPAPRARSDSRSLHALSTRPRSAASCLSIKSGW